MSQTVRGASSPMYGRVRVEIEGVGSYTLCDVQGVTAVGCVNLVGAALMGKPFKATQEEWELGYRKSDNTILVRRA